MSHPNPERDERVRQIRERLATHRQEVDKYRGLRWADGSALRYYRAPDDIDYLLSLLDSQVAQIPYCINCWHAVPHNGPAGTVDDACTHTGCNCGYYTPASSDDTATRMRGLCVAKVKDLPTDHRDDRQGSLSAESFKALAVKALESLTLDGEQEKSK